MFSPTKTAACRAMEQFLPHAGRDYAERRNYDEGPESPSSVSQLSPWIRNRMLPEWRVLEAVLGQHSIGSASKFIDEVCWRTYWKGWLHLRPSVWDAYLKERSELLETHKRHSTYTQAIAGRTGIECFDAWNKELMENHYLHNHTRMWYASIWIHTLKLPWQLGADWFFRHLLDGDPASNTLSWRWVAGMHTQGKCYLARTDNIRKYTRGRFEVGSELAADPAKFFDSPRPAARKLPELKPIPQTSRLGLLISDDDLSFRELASERFPSLHEAGLSLMDSYKQLGVHQNVIRFRQDALASLSLEARCTDAKSVLQWSKQNDLEGIIVAEPSIGPASDTMRGIAKALENDGKSVYHMRSWWDDTLYPHASHGFFRFKKAIPQVLDRIMQFQNQLAGS